MAPSRVVAQLPAQPLTEGGISQLQKEILEHRNSMDSHIKDHEKAAKGLEKQEKRIRDIKAGQVQGSEKHASGRIKGLKDEMGYHANQISREESIIKFKQGRIEKNDEVAKARQEAEAALKAKQDAAKEARLNPVHPLFGKTSANAPKPRITKTIVRKPVAQQPAAINRPLPSKPASTKDSLNKATHDAGVKKNTSGSAAQKTMEKKVLDKAMSEAISQEEAEKTKAECARPSGKLNSKNSRQTGSQVPAKEPTTTSTASDPSKSSKKRKSNDSPTREEHGPAKKARSNQEQTEEKTEMKSPKESSPTSSTTQTKEPTSANKKRKATGSTDDNEAAPPSKKHQPSSGSDLAKAGDKFVPQKTTMSRALKSSGKKPIVTNREEVRVFLKEKNKPKGHWTTKTAGEAWIRGVKEPEHIVEAATPRSNTTNSDSNDLRGLLNPHNACFANSAIQALNCVLSDEQVQELRGDGDLSMFGVPYKKLMQTTDMPGKEPAGIQELRCNISMTAAMYGKIETAPYLGQLLIDLRDGASHKCKKGEGNKFVTPVLFQQVFAYGCGESDARLRFGCSTQEDAQEFMMAVIDAIIEEGHTFMRDLFQVNKTIAKKCTSCGLEIAGKEADLAVSVTPPKSTPTVEKVKSTSSGPRLAELLGAKVIETDRPEGSKCEQCGEVGRQENTTTISQLSNHVLVQVARTGSEKNETGANTRLFKNQTAVEWIEQGTQFEFGDAQYEAAAVIRHKGDKPTAGHYDAFIKRGSTWSLTNDESVRESVSIQQMADGKDGQCAVVLLRKLLQE